MLRSLFTVGGFTGLSRILGFLRDMLVGHYLGAGPAANAWVAAFRFPNLFRRVFGEGAFNAAFVPLYSRKLEEGGDGDADGFASRTLSLMAVILTVICILAFIFMRPITRVVACGFTGDTFEMAVTLSRITVVYLIFVCLMAALSGVLNSRRVFGPPAFAYVVLNLVFLAGLLFVVPRTGNPEFVLSWCVVIAGVLQFGLVLGACLRRGVRIRPVRPVLDSQMKRLGLLMVPGLLSAGIQQVNLIVGQTVASFQDGGVAFIYYSDRVNQLPLGLIGMAFGVVLLPEITRNLRGGREDAARSSLGRGIELSLLISLPAMVAMIAIPEELMFGLFKSGRFTGEDARQSGLALAAFAAGAPAYILARVMQPGFFAREDTRTPMNYTLVSAVVNMILAVLLFLTMRHVGCALATSIAGWVNVILLGRGLRRIGFLEFPGGFAGRFWRMVISSVLMGATVWGLAQWLSPYLHADGRMIRFAALGAVVLAGTIVYLGLVLATRVTTIGELKGRLRRNR